jgi:hypothetical protein
MATPSRVLDAANRQHKIRLAQIDAPEKDQPFGQASKKQLSDLVFLQSVQIEAETTDRYGRTVARVRVNGKDVNLAQIQYGMAWVYTQYAHDKQYFDAEDQARASRTGLWSDANPMPPWEWRHGGKTKVTKEITVSPTHPPQGMANSGCETVGHRCSEMRDCAEAKRALACGNSRLDGDGDGVPCESLCR